MVGDIKQDVWFGTHNIVWEIKGSDLFRSKTYKCGIREFEENTEYGIELRFPRFIREKDCNGHFDASKPSKIYEIYQKYKNVQNVENKIR